MLKVILNLLSILKLINFKLQNLSIKNFIHFMNNIQLANHIILCSEKKLIETCIKQLLFILVIIKNLSTKYLCAVSLYYKL